MVLPPIGRAKAPMWCLSFFEIEVMVLKVLVLNGCINKNGKTQNLLNLFLKEVDKNVYSIDIIETQKMQINHCIGCHSCEKDGMCIYDDLNEVYEKIEESDIIVLASPVYFASFTTPLKTLVDRLQVMYARKFVLNKQIKEKKGVLIFTSGRDNQKMLDCILLQSRYVFLSVGAKFLDYICQLNTDKIMNIEEKVIQKSKEIANNL